jgi:hypothetical protein
MRRTSVWILTLCLVLGTAALGFAQSSTSTSAAATTETKTTTTTKTKTSTKAHHPAAKHMKGEVTAVDATAKTFSLKGKTADESFTLTEKGTVTVNGKKSTLADVKVGDMGTATYTTDKEKKNWASHLSAKSPKTPPPPKTGR